MRFVFLPCYFPCVTVRKIFSIKRIFGSFVRSDRKSSIIISLEIIWWKISTGLVDVRSCIGGLAVYRQTFIFKIELHVSIG